MTRTTWEMLTAALGRELGAEEWHALRDDSDRVAVIAAAHGFYRRILADGSAEWRTAGEPLGTLPI